MIKVVGLILLFLPLVATSKELFIALGSGSFTMKGGGNHIEKNIEVFYHKPVAFNQKTRVLFVLPGSGRNGWSYRDSWIEASEKYNVLVLSPSYSEKYYPKFWSYNIAGMISDVVINKEKTAIKSYSIVKDSSHWIFDDFDKIFDVVVSNLDLKANTYDMFGHSAGGQILHRFALFDHDNKANQIIASNSGWYTVPTLSERFPYGLKESVYSNGNYKGIFSSKLIVFLGEKDNEQETRGHLVRNLTVDKQGTHRLARGKHFYSQAKTTAKNLKTEFKWNMKVVKGVGHDYKLMGKAASKLLYHDHGPHMYK